MKYGLSVWSLVLFLGLTAYAGDVNVTNIDIKGAFGFQFDDAVPADALSNKGIVQCIIPFGNFTKCFLGVTGERKIYLIRSEAIYSDENDAKNEFTRTIGLLEKKYQCSFSDISSQQLFRDAVSVFQVKSSTNQKSITMILYQRAIRIIYVDDEIRYREINQQRDQERKQNTDISAL